MTIKLRSSRFLQQDFFLFFFFGGCCFLARQNHAVSFRRFFWSPSTSNVKHHFSFSSTHALCSFDVAENFLINSWKKLAACFSVVIFAKVCGQFTSCYIWRDGGAETIELTNHEQLRLKFVTQIRLSDSLSVTRGCSLDFYRNCWKLSPAAQLNFSWTWLARKTCTKLSESNEVFMTHNSSPKEDNMPKACAKEKDNYSTNSFCKCRKSPFGRLCWKPR